MIDQITVHMEEGLGFFVVTARTVCRTFTYDAHDGTGLPRETQFDRARVYAQGVTNGVRVAGGKAELHISANVRR